MSEADVKVPYSYHPYAWQQMLWQRLEDLLVQQRLPHALLLSGADGIGKERFAHAFVSRLLCPSSRNGVACGQCKSCSLLAAGTHPDLMWLTREVDDKGKVAKFIKVDQIRELVEFAVKSSQLGGWRVVVMTPAHLLNTAAANALLKTLEEPGREMVLILLSSQPLSLMPTLRSRCQQWPMPVPSEAEAMAWLAPQVGGDEATARLLLALTRGAPLAALNLREAEWFSQREALLRDLMQLSQQRQTALATAQRWHSLGAEPLLTALLSLLDDLVAAASGVEGVVKHGDLAPIIGRMSSHFQPAALLNFRQGVAERQRLLAGNVQGSALIDATFSDWVALTSR